MYSISIYISQHVEFRMIFDCVDGALIPTYYERSMHLSVCVSICMYCYNTLKPRYVNVIVKMSE